MRKFAAAAIAALVLTQPVIPGVAQTLNTTSVVENVVVEGYDKYLPTDFVLPTPEPAAVVTEKNTPAVTTTSATTTPVAPKAFKDSEKVSYVFTERNDKEVDELLSGEEYSVRLKFDMEKFATGEVLELGTEGMSFKDADMPQMMLVNNLGYPIAKFEDVSKEAGKPQLRVEKIETREDITSDFGWQAQMILQIEVDPNFELAATAKFEPVVPLVGVIVEGKRLELIEPDKAQEHPLPTTEIEAEIAPEATETLEPAPIAADRFEGLADVELTEEVEAPREGELGEPLASPTPVTKVAEVTEEKAEVTPEQTPVLQAAAEVTTPAGEEPLADAMAVANAVEKLSGDLAKVAGDEKKAAQVPFAAPAENGAAVPVAPVSVAPSAQVTPVPAAQPAKQHPMLAMTGASVLGVLLLATIMFIIGSSFLARPKGRHS